MTKISFRLGKRAIRNLREEAEERLEHGYDAQIKAEFNLDLEESKKRLMRLKKSELCDIIISAFVLERQESVKYFLADKLREGVNAVLFNKQ